MNYSRNVTIAALAAIAVASSAGAQSKDEREVRALSDQWQRDIAAQNVNRIVALHAPDAVVMMANMPVANGSTAIRNWYGGMVKSPNLSLNWTPAKIDVAGG